MILIYLRAQYNYPILSPTINPNLKNIIQISAGSTHSLAVNKSGEVFVFGYNAVLIIFLTNFRTCN
jgi:alpha-tubulin suppressor-like RCC1 family protein